MNIERAKKVGVVAAVVPWTLIAAGIYALLKKNDIENPAKWMTLGSLAIIVPTIVYLNPIDYDRNKNR